MRKPLEKMRFGLVDLGGAAMQMRPSFIAHPRVELVACVDPNQQARDSFARDFNASAYERMEALCEVPTVYPVYTETPNQFHGQHPTMVEETRKQTIVNKPMTLQLT